MGKKKDKKESGAGGGQGVDGKEVLRVLNRILELELAGVVRYMHYSFMIFGHHRIPIVKWLRGQADESLAHATAAGEHVTSLGGHPSLRIGELLETHKHGIEEILEECIQHEGEGLAAYEELLALVEGRDVMLEEYARSMVAAEQGHLHEIRKMRRRPA